METNVSFYIYIARICRAVAEKKSQRAPKDKQSEHKQTALFIIDCDLFLKLLDFLFPNRKWSAIDVLAFMLNKVHKVRRRGGRIQNRHGDSGGWLRIVDRRLVKVTRIPWNFLNTDKTKRLSFIFHIKLCVNKKS